jgi:uncharacterized protein YqjF (DUF2071 family)
MSTDDPPSRSVVLRATARHRAGVCYAVAPERLASFLPDGLVPQVWEGAAVVGLVGVHLTDVRVWDIRGPGLRHVPAVELQAAVQHPPTGRTGTLTLQAYVPRRLVAWGARLLYHERVAVASMQPVRYTSDDRVEMTYRFDWKGREQRLRLEGARADGQAPAGAATPFVQGRRWRFAAAADGPLRCARVEQDAGDARRADEAHVTVRWRAAFGAPGVLLADRSPAAAWLGAGGSLALHWRTTV